MVTSRRKRRLPSNGCVVVDDGKLYRVVLREITFDGEPSQIVDSVEIVTTDRERLENYPLAQAYGWQDWGQVNAGNS